MEKKTKQNIVLRKVRSSGVSESKVRLAERRKKTQMRVFSILGVLFIFAVALLFVGLWNTNVRVSNIHVTTNDTSLVPQIKNALSGSNFLFIPNNSIFFLDKERVRKTVLDLRPNVAAVSVSRTGLDSISVTPSMRTPLARWCGTAASSTSKDYIDLDITKARGCYLFDSTGFIYTPDLDVSYASSTQKTLSTSTPLVPFRVYTAITNVASPFMSTVIQINKLSGVFDFAREIGNFGSHVQSIVIRGDEVDLFLKDKTRVTYVIGNEQKSYALLESTKKKISIGNGSLLYVDLRFAGKVYFMPVASSK